MSFTQALSTLRRVLVARWMPSLMASSKPCSEVALNSITRATDINPPLFSLSLRNLYPTVRALNARAAAPSGAPDFDPCFDLRGVSDTLLGTDYNEQIH